LDGTPSRTCGGVEFSSWLRGGHGDLPGGILRARAERQNPIQSEQGISQNSQARKTPRGFPLDATALIACLLWSAACLKGFPGDASQARDEEVLFNWTPTNKTGLTSARRRFCSAYP